MSTANPTKPLDQWRPTSDGRVVDRTGATVALCYQLPLDPVPAAIKAQSIARACNAFHRHLAALRDLLGNAPQIQERDGRVICINCYRDYTGDEPVPEHCDIDDCPAFDARRAVAVADEEGTQLKIKFVGDTGEGTA